MNSIDCQPSRSYEPCPNRNSRLKDLEGCNALTVGWITFYWHWKHLTVASNHGLIPRNATRLTMVWNYTTAHFARRRTPSMWMTRPTRKNEPETQNAFINSTDRITWLTAYTIANHNRLGGPTLSIHGLRLPEWPTGSTAAYISTELAHWTVCVARHVPEPTHEWHPCGLLANHGHTSYLENGDTEGRSPLTQMASSTPSGHKVNWNGIERSLGEPQHG